MSSFNWLWMLDIGDIKAGLMDAQFWLCRSRVKARRESGMAEAGGAGCPAGEAEEKLLDNGELTVSAGRSKGPPRCTSCLMPGLDVASSKLAP